MSTLSHGLAELRSTPFRAFLSGISLTIGVLAVIAISTLGAVTREVFVAVAEQQHGRYSTLTTEVPLVSPTGDEARAALDSARGLVEGGGAVALIGSSPAVTGIGSLPSSEFGTPLRQQLISYVAGDLPKVRRLPLLSGRWFDAAADIPPEVVVNTVAARIYGLPGTDVAVVLDRRSLPIRARIVGVIADGQGEANVYIGMLAALRSRPGALDGGTVAIFLHQPGAVERSLQGDADAIASALGLKAKAQPVQRADRVDELLDELQRQQRIFLIIAILSLVISAVGILNIGLASVAEQSRELVLRRAVGATRLGIVGQKLAAALMSATLASILAVAITFVAFQAWVPTQVPSESAIALPALPWEACLLGLGAALATTLLGAAIPAVVAARVDLALALRD